MESVVAVQAGPYAHDDPLFSADWLFTLRTTRRALDLLRAEGRLFSIPERDVFRVTGKQIENAVERAFETESELLPP